MIRIATNRSGAGLAALTLAASVALSTGRAHAAEYRISVVMGTTGPSAFVAVPATNAMKIAEDDLRAEGLFGTDTLKVTYEDNRSDKQEAITLLNKIAQDKSTLVFIGPVSSSEALAAAPAAVSLKVPLFTTGTNPAILAAGEWAFKISENADDFIRPLGDYIGKVVRPKACYLISIRDNEAYLVYSKVFKEGVTAAGTRIVGEDTILSSESNFAALATKIVDSGADCLYVSTPPELGANLIVQARQAGMARQTVLVGNQNMASDKYTAIGGKAVEGTYLIAEFSPFSDSAVARDFVKKYSARYNSLPDAWAAVGYSMMKIAAHAVKNAGPNPTRESVRAALAASKDVPVVIGSGKFSLDAKRVPHFGAVVLQIKDGKVAPPATR
jgi:branched-chain amino acid transport system substrate-binding protein